MAEKFRRLKLNAILPILIIFLGGCVTIYNPATEKKETYLINSQQEINLGADLDKELQSKLKMMNSPRQYSRLETIGTKLARFSDRSDLIFHFRIVEDKELNAFALPGGFIYVNSGLMESADDAELAGVVAHEIGHIAARHSVKQLQTAMGYQMILGIITGISGQADINSALNVVFNLVNLGYSRQDEFLADKLAVRYVRRTGYSPIGLLTFFNKLKEEGRKKGTGTKLVFLSSHPPIEQRIAKIEEEIKLYPY